MSFVNLHVHSDHSKLDGAATLERYFTRAAELNQPAISINDHGSMSGHWDAWNLGKKMGVKPILGIEAYVAPGSRHEKSPIYWGEPDQKKMDVSGRGAYTHMTMIALNVTGLRNLYKMHYYAGKEGFYYKPRIDLELMRQYNEGILVTTGCCSGAVPVRLRLDQWDEAVYAYEELQQIFGQENVYVEVMDHDIAEEDLNDKELNQQLIKLAHQVGAPIVATNDSHYCDASDDKIHDAFICLQTHSKLDDEKRFRFNGSGFHLRSREEMEERFSYLPEALDNTLKIADRVESYDVAFEFRNRMPHLPEVAPEDEVSVLRDRTLTAVEEMFPGNPTYRARAIYELDIIEQAGFPGYFLVLSDILSWAKKQGIRIGPARGSAGGSLVCFVNHITGVDPILHRIPFERFLNLDRVSFPDIDIDFDIHRRHEVVEYTRQRFGNEYVCNILTLGTIKPKRAMLDAANVQGFPHSLGDQMSKAFPKPISGFLPGLDVVTDKSHPRYKDAAGLRAIIDDDPDARATYELAIGLEGLIRGTGIHAGGVIISSEPVYEVIPVHFSEGTLITGWDQPALEPIGLIKYDFLGLQNLSIIDATLEHIKTMTGEEVVVEDLPLDNAKTYQMLARGDSLGVFQLDSTPIRQLLKRMRPTEFEDITATIALFRPGPMGADAHNTYADRKTGRKKLQPIHPEFAEPLKEVLERTQGVICYQEQVMEALQIVAGYTLGQADIVRRVMGKKKPEAMAALEPELREKMLANGYSEEAFCCLWDILVPFSAYAFNRAHSVGYALIAYWTAYLKANYPEAFFSALLTGEADDTENLSRYLEDARKLGVRILPPDINESQSNFTPTKGGVRFGLGAIKGVGEAVISSVQSRQYAALEEFYENVPDKVNVRALQALIAGGAFDSFGDRSTHYDAAQKWLERAKATRKVIENGDRVMLMPRYHLPDKLTDKSRMRAWELESMGLELTLPEIRVTLARPLGDIEWDWVNKALERHPGVQKIQYNLNGLTFTSGRMVRPDDKLVKQLGSMDVLTVEME